MSQATTLTRAGEEVTQLANQALPPVAIARNFRHTLPNPVAAETYTSLKEKNGDDFNRDTEFLAVRCSDMIEEKSSYVTGSAWVKPLPESHSLSETHFMIKDSNGEWSELLATRVVFAYPKLELGNTYQALWSTDSELMHGATVQCMKEGTEDQLPQIRIVNYRGESVALSRVLPDDAVTIATDVLTGRPVLPTSTDRLWDADGYEEAYPSRGDAPYVGLTHEEYRNTRIMDALPGTLVGLDELLCGVDYLMTGIDHPDNINGHLTPVTRDDWVIGRIDTDGDIDNIRVIDRVDFDIVTAPRRRGSLVIHRHVRTVGADMPFKAYKLNQGWGKSVSGMVGNGDPLKEMRLTEAVRTIAELTSKREKMNEALNELAGEQDWCSEFEDSVIPLGFEGREGRGDADYTVTIDVDFSYSEEELSRSDIERMESVLGISGVTSVNVEATGQAQITVTTTAPRNAGEEGELSEYISGDDVESELNSTYISVDDWNITDWEFSE